jgi:DNA-binding transcriptional MerR regulator
MVESAFRHFMFGDTPPPTRPRRARAPKEAGAFLTIGELAEQLQLEQHVLRYWESKFPQIQPLKRAGGRRYYRPEDVEIIRQIQSMLYKDGYTIRGAQKALEGGAESELLDAPETPSHQTITPTVHVSKTKIQQLLNQLQEMRRLIRS